MPSSPQLLITTILLSVIIILTFKNIYLFGCTRSQLQHGGSLILIATCRIFSCGMQTSSWGMWDLVPQSGIEPGPLHWEHRVLATGLPGEPLS